ncbi:MAG: cobalamin-dependent protein [Candidatus Altiarchaeota archaeon]
MSLRICLVMPKIDDNNLTPPLGLLYIAAVLEKEGHTVKYFDARIEGDVIGKLKEFRPDVLGVTAVTPSFLSAVEIAENAKKALPKLKVVFGGPHPSALPKETLESGPVDFVVIGEGEYPMRDLCRLLGEGEDPSTVANLAYMKDRRYVRNARVRILTEEELNSLPFPALHLLDVERYFTVDKSYGVFLKDRRNLPIISSRGCPSSCTYCSRMMGAKFRGRTPESVLAEMEHLIRDFNVGEIHIVDDNFTHDRSRAMRILDGIIERKFNIAIKFPNGMRADRTDPELFMKMKLAGVYSIGFGIESGSPRILELMRKGVKIERVAQAIRDAKEAGLLVGGAFIIGYPGENKESILETIKFATSVPLDTASIVTIVPMPGTEVRRICEEGGYLTEDAKDWSKYLFIRNRPYKLFETEHLSFEDIKKYTDLFHKRFYMRPTYVLRMLKVLNITQIIRGVKTVFFPFLDH